MYFEDHCFAEPWGPQPEVILLIHGATVDLRERLSEITMPTLVITTEGSALAEVAAVREHLRRIPQADLVVVPSESYHIAAAQPDETARIVLRFINSHAAKREF